MRATHSGWGHRSALLGVGAMLVAGCGSADGSARADETISAPTPSAVSVSSSSSSNTPVDPVETTATTSVRQATHFDGHISAEESAAATDLVMANPIAQALIADPGAVLSEWQPVEIEGEQRGAGALLDLAAPTLMQPMMITSQPLPDEAHPASPPATIASADDYMPREQRLGEQLVKRYWVAVDLPTMRIIALGPRPDPPTTTLPSEDQPP